MNWTLLIIEIIRLIVTIISIIITCFSIVVTSTITVISVYLLYKARTSPYREVLYSKQLEGYLELANTITETTREGVRFLRDGGSKTKKGKVLYSQTMDKITNLYFEYSKWAMLLPREISSLVINFNEEIERILDLPFNKEENSILIVNANVKILNEIRKIMRAEKLSKETFKLIEKIKG